MSKAPIRVDYIKGRLPDWIWRPMRALATALIGPINFSRKTGHFKSSLAGTACDQTGSAIPWYTYPAVDFISQRDYTGRNILEFGAGQSTIWWAKRSNSVFSIEPDESWTTYLQPIIKEQGNTEVHFVPVDLETRTVEPIRKLISERASVQKFDVIIIDGHLRGELVKVALDHLTEDGAIIMDNSEGYGFHEALLHTDCKRIDFYGFTSCASKRSCTSIAFRENTFLLNNDVPITRPN